MKERCLKNISLAVLCGMVVTLGLLLGGCPDAAGGSGPSAAQEEADQFKFDQNAVLNKTADTVSLGDEEAIDAALSAYESLSAEAKALLGAEKRRLDGLKLKIAEIKSQSGNEDENRDENENEDKDGNKNEDEDEDETPVIGEVFSTLTLMQTWLESQAGNTVTNPYAVAYTGNETPEDIYAALTAADRFVELDLSASSTSGFAAGTEPGRAKIVALVLPNSLTVIPDSGTGNTTKIFRGFANLKTIQSRRLIALGERTFSGRIAPNLTTVILPRVEIVNSYAFDGCANLTTVNLPKATIIGGQVFSDCTSLQEINLPHATNIGGHAFWSCANIRTVNLPMVNSIGGFAFMGCTSLATVILGSTPPSTIGDKLFNDTAADARTITFKVPDLTVYYAAGSPWTDRIGLNSAVGYYWDGVGRTKDNLTVALESINP